MKPHQIIGNYCQLYGVTVPEIDYSETQFFVAVSHECAKVMHWRGPSALLGRIVCEAMKRGVVIYVHNGWDVGELETNMGQTLRPEKARHATGAEHRTPVPLGDFRAGTAGAPAQETPETRVPPHLQRQFRHEPLRSYARHPHRGSRAGGLIYTARYTRLAEGFPAGVAWQTIGASVRCAFFITTINHLRP